MKNPIHHTCIITLPALLALGSSFLCAAPLGTAFTYQGRLTENGTPYTGSAEFQATLWDAANGGTALATNAAGSVMVGVTNGLFGLRLDFGANFAGDAKWLELEVRTTIGSLTKLAPRQPLTPTPYALYAPSAGNAALLNGQSPTAYAPATGSTAYVARAGDTMTGTLAVPANGFQAGGNQLVLAGGKVGIGTPAPAEKLEVAGAVVLGATTNSTPKAGTMRWTGTDFQGYTGTNWVSLTGRGNPPTGTVTPYTNMIWIAPGAFVMGSPANEVDRYSDEGPQTTVTLTRGFYVSKYEVTQSEWQALMGNNPSHFTATNGYGDDLSRPVETVSWNDAVGYCLFLTQRERDAGRIPAGYQYRLPTEAEWEYACRAGTTTRFSYGDDPGYTFLNNYAWHSGNSDSTTHPVGRRLHNPLALDDMHGNVWEWCQDWYAAYPGGSVTDPQGPGTGSNHVMRGGGWESGERNCRSAKRDNFGAGSKDKDLGFRVVLAPSQ